MNELSAIWPFFGLILTTPRLELRPIQDADIPAAVKAALSGIHEPGKSPFSNPWTELPKDELGANMAGWYWRCRAGMAAESWTLLLGIWHNDEFIGCQDIEAKNFASLKTVSTGSWLKKGAQGLGLGKEMRAAALSYAFDYLNAEVATSEAAIWNKESLGVSASLGYEPNGIYRDQWGIDVVQVQRVRLTSGSFTRPDWKLKVEGHEATAQFLGL
ncbi:GNAT family N-acetyltransferase [Arthrobacter bambusae]|uniref:GNAT family N-acetyltransferase n=1 Tax=Arthrobacter bambusae TaxID=1338426 RepID=UPI002781465D|nr:GNAT family protein [Arthrobacter bambusae]MDQ0238406.1 RimJ/RimL family protein N-acetyltransferase [Arthrobacter bambusae]